MSQDTPRVEVYHRLPTGRWEYREGSEGSVQLAAGATLDLSTLYDDLPI